ncbi:MAG: DUF167 domain-containing protein [Terrimicrobiaceae bacterium]
MRLGIKAVPGASKNSVVGWLGDDLKIRITAPACDGKANEALCGFLAAWLGVARRNVSILSGASSRRKIVEIEGVDREVLCARIGRG